MSTTRLQMPANCRRGSRRPTKQTRTTNNMDFDSTRSLSLSRNNGPKQKLLFPLLVRTISIDSAGPCHAPTCPTTPATVTGNAPPGATSENICQMQHKCPTERWQMFVVVGAGVGTGRGAYAEVGVPMRAYVNFFIVVASN